MISIIIPVYNAEKWLNRCIDSVLAQTLTDWELILINDGSTDSSPAICDKRAAEDSRIHVVHQANQGASLARRNGIDTAKGEYLTFIDSDDQVEANYLEVLLTTIQKFGTPIAACASREKASNEGTRLLSKEVLQSRFFHYDFWSFYGKIYQRQVFQGIYFPTHTINEDYVVMAQLFYKYPEMPFAAQRLYHYNENDTGLSHAHLSLRMFDEYYNKLWVLDFFEKSNPVYVPHAKAQLAETCIKLCREVREKDRQNQFASEYRTARGFLRNNLLSLLFNRHLLMGLKAMVIKYAL